MEKYSKNGEVTQQVPKIIQVPKGYKCDMCGKTGEKLWREYNVPAGQTQILCQHCVEQLQTQRYIEGWKSDFSRGLGNTIGNFLPAIPGPEGYLRYNRGLDERAQAWWDNLPPQRPEPSFR